MTSLEQFSALVTRRRRDRGWSKHELAAAALMAESELCRFENNHGKIGTRPVLALCAALTLPDGAAWALAVTGRLPGPLTLSQAQRVLSTVDVEYPPARLYRGALKPKLTCAVCQHAWKQYQVKAPDCCPHCESIHWREGMTEAQMAVRAKRSASLKRIWAARKQRPAPALAARPAAAEFR